MNIHTAAVRRILIAIVIGAMVGWLSVPNVQAAPPSLINYQGRLRTAGGTAITDATTIQFSIYNHATNGASTDSASEAGSLLWKETYSTGSGSCAQIDPDANGYFTVQLGNCSAFPSYLDFTQGTLYVGIKISSDSEASPRMRLLSHPYALNANRLGDFVDTGSSAVRGEAIGTATALTQGYNSPQILLQGSGWTGAAAANREMKLQNTVIDASNYRLTVLNTSDTALFTLTDDGLVGISDATPESTLDINVASGDATFSISDPDVAHGLTTWMETDAYGSFTPYSSTTGGLDLRSTSDTDATAMAIRGVIGSTNPTDTTAALLIGGAKSDGTTGVAALGSAETVMQVMNFSTVLATWLGNGNLGIGDTTPAAALVVGSDAAAGFANGSGDVYVQNDLEVDGTLYAATINPSFTQGSVVFQGAAALAQDNSNFFWDDTNNALGLGTATPASFAALNVKRTTTNAVSAGLVSDPAFSVTASTANEVMGIYISPSISVDAGQSLTTRYRGLASSTLRNSGVADAGTVATLAGLATTYGHGSTNGTTTNAYGVWVVPYHSSAASTIDTSAGIYIDSAGATGATVNNYYGLYQEDATALNYFAGNLGLGDTTPDYTLEVSSAAASDSTLALSDGDVAHGLTTWLQTDAYAYLGPYSSTTGGLDLRSTSDTNATAMIIRAVIGSSDPTDTTPGLIIGSAKSNGTTGVAALGAAETVMQVYNFSTPLATWLGSGALGLNDTTPDYTLEVAVASGDSSFALSDPDVAHGVTDLAQTDAFVYLKPLSSTAGGLDLTTFSDTSASALSLGGVIGSADPTDTTAAVLISGAKKDAGTSYQALGNSETVLQIWNAATAIATWLGNGNLGLRDTTPDYSLEVSSFAGGSTTFALSDADLAHGITSLDQTDVFFSLNPANATNGGAVMRGFSAAASTVGLNMGGLMVADPTDTTPAIYLAGAKSDGGTSIAVLGNAETVLQIGNATTPLVTVLGDGKMGIGDTVPANGGLVVAAGVTIGTDSSNNLIDDASNGAGSTTLYIGNSSINVTASDIRLKENITPSTIDGLAVINELNVKDFDWKPGTKWFGRGRATGLIAQEVYDILPQVVDRPVDPNSTWSIEYHHLVPYLIKAIQEQQAVLESLQLVSQSATTLDATNPTFGGALELTSQLAFGVDTVGQAIIQTNDERVTVTFTQPYAYLPVVTLTPIGLFGGQYAVENVTFAGFDIVVADPVMTDTTFGWHVFGAKQGKVYSSDGSVADLVAEETTVAVPSSASSPAATESGQESVPTADESGTSVESIPAEESTETAVTESPATPTDESAPAETVVTESAAPADESTAASDTATDGSTEAATPAAEPATEAPSDTASAPATTDTI